MHDKIKAWMEHGRSCTESNNNISSDILSWTSDLDSLVNWSCGKTLLLSVAAFTCPQILHRSLSWSCTSLLLLSDTLPWNTRVLSQALSSRVQVGPGGETTFHGLYCFSIKLFKSAFFFSRARSNTSLIINGAEESLGLAKEAYLANMREWIEQLSLSGPIYTDYGIFMLLNKYEPLQWKARNSTGVILIPGRGKRANPGSKHKYMCIAISISF